VKFRISEMRLDGNTHRLASHVERLVNPWRATVDDDQLGTSRREVRLCGGATKPSPPQSSPASASTNRPSTMMNRPGRSTHNRVGDVILSPLNPGGPASNGRTTSDMYRGSSSVENRRYFASVECRLANRSRFS
jgi:hypothetical protein